jgi:hypothetical protein
MSEAGGPKVSVTMDDGDAGGLANERRLVDVGGSGNVGAVEVPHELDRRSSEEGKLVPSTGASGPYESPSPFR